MLLRRMMISAAAAMMAAVAVGEETPAFPGAEGYGMYTTGGRAGAVYHVTKLTDDGSEGTLRWAVGKKGARTIVFDVSGIIELRSALTISSGSLTIAGQTAPGDGICLKNYHVYVNADNVIIRFLHFRLGVDKPDGVDANGNPTQDRDAIWGRRHSDIIIDHCSMSWCTDECASFYDNENFTMQWCLVAESLRGSIHPKGYHGYGGIWGGRGASFHHNLVAHHDSRNPRLCGSRYSNNPDAEMVDLRNNVFYNWGATNSGYAGEGGSYNFVNNYYKSGPATASNIKYRIFQANADDGSNSQPQGVYGHFYVSGNYMEDKGDNWDWNGIDVDNKNNWAMTKESIHSYSEYTHAFVTTHTARVAYDKVVRLAGASLVRDAVDAHVAEDCLTRTAQYRGSRLGGKGIIDDPMDVGGWPTYATKPMPMDSDGDGMPDEWELAHGLNPSDAADGAAVAMSRGGYTNLELYINSLVCDIMSDGLSDGLTQSDYTCDEEERLDSALLIKHGKGSLNQTVEQDSAIVAYSVAWENAETVSVEGLPHGIVYEIDAASRSVAISGVASDEPGIYPFTISTIGNVHNTATKSGSVTITARESTAAEDRVAGRAVSIVPNPVEDCVEVTLSAADGEIVAVSVVDLMGKEMEMRVMAAAERVARERLCLGALPSGVYIIMVKSGSYVYTERMVKK